MRVAGKGGAVRGGLYGWVHEIHSVATWHSSEIGKGGVDSLREGDDTFPPHPFVHALSLPLEDMGTDQTNSTF